MKKSKLISDYQWINRKKLCSSRVPVITKKPLSNLTTDKGFLNCGSSGDRTYKTD